MRNAGHQTSALTILLIAAVFALTAAGGSPASGAQQKVRKPAQKKRTVSNTVLLRARADSLARLRVADSLIAVARAHAVADSLAREDSLARARAADTLRVVRNEAFGVGERLVFDVNYGFITAGEAVMAIPGFDSVAGRKCYRIQFTVNSLPSFSWIYKVEDRYLTFVDVSAIIPWRFEQHIREGSYQRDFVADFDHKNLLARTSEGDYPIPKYVHDILSAFYYTRTFTFSGFKPGDTLSMANFYKDKAHELVVRFLGRQELEVAAGTFRTIVVEPLVKEGGLFKSEGRIVIWLTDDERKIPVRVNTKVVIGSIDTELREYSGLIGPVTSRIR
jgi:hypothetical protein